MASQAAHRQGSKKGTGKVEQVDQEDVNVRARLVMLLARAMVEKGMTQVQAARALGTDQPTLSKVLRGRTASVSLDKLVSWLLVLGRSVEIRVFEPAGASDPRFTVVVSSPVDG